MVGLYEHELRRALAEGADAAVIVSPSPDRGDECQQLAFALVGLTPHDIVTIAHTTGPPTAPDLLRWTSNGYRLRAATAGDVSLPLAGGGVSPAHARRVVVEYVGDALGDGGSTSAALAMSELVNNALQHARDGTLQLQRFDGGIHLAVVDHEPARWPMLRSTDRMADAGRGLGIVASMSATWGISAVDDVKAVWCEVM